MFEKFKEYVAGKKEGSASDYNLTYDVAIPEIHIHKTSPETREKNTDESIHFDNVAIPEVHLPKKENK